MRLSRRTRKRGAAGYLFGETDVSGHKSTAAVADRRRLRQEKIRKKRYKHEPLVRKRIVRIKGRDKATNRLVVFKFKSSKPREAVRRLLGRGELNIERVKI
jgi:hypothetical protein